MILTLNQTMFVFYYLASNCGFISQPHGGKEEINVSYYDRALKIDDVIRTNDVINFFLQSIPKPLSANHTKWSNTL